MLGWLSGTVVSTGTSQPEDLNSTPARGLSACSLHVLCGIIGIHWVRCTGDSKFITGVKISILPRMYLAFRARIAGICYGSWRFKTEYIMRVEVFAFFTANHYSYSIK